MSDDLDIRHGGTVAVDPGSLRASADLLNGVIRELDDAAASSRWAASLTASSGPASDELTWRIDRLTASLDLLADRARVLGERIRRAAAVYEYVELAAERAACVDPTRTAQIDVRLRELVAEHPWALARAAFDRLGPDVAVPGSLVAQASAMGSMIGPLFAFAAAWDTVLLAGLIAMIDRGRIPRDERLLGPTTAIELTVVSRATGTAPSTLRDVLGRIPDGAARVRVERYSMPDGRREYVVYVTGTHPGDKSGREPFDGDADFRLYRGERTASYDATVEAVRAAGVAPGDTVHLVGYSQGAMVVSHLALEGGYDVKTLITIGSPVEANVDHSVLAVSLRHDDDPIAALAGGGHPAGVGAPGSFVAERTADPAPGLHDFGVPAHQLPAYQRTAALLDASSDPRMDAVRDMLARLGEASAEETVEYGAKRK